MFDKFRKLRIKFINFKEEADKNNNLNEFNKSDKKKFNMFNSGDKNDDSKSNMFNSYKKNNKKKFNIFKSDNKNETVNVQKVKEARSYCYCCSLNRNRIY